MSVCDSHASATDKLTFSKIERNTCLVVGTFHYFQERDHLIIDSSLASFFCKILLFIQVELMFSDHIVQLSILV